MLACAATEQERPRNVTISERLGEVLQIPCCNAHGESVIEIPEEFLRLGSLIQISISIGNSICGAACGAVLGSEPYD